MKVYKIRDPKTGLFKRGGISVGWSKHGKAWSGTGPIRCHLSDCVKYGKGIDPSWEVCEYEREPSNVIPAREFYVGGKK